MDDMLGGKVKRDRKAEKRIEEQRVKEELRHAEEKSDESERKARNMAGNALVKTSEAGAVSGTRKTKLSGIV